MNSSNAILAGSFDYPLVAWSILIAVALSLLVPELRVGERGCLAGVGVQ
jgi:hypothetical protein